MPRSPKSPPQARNPKKNPPKKDPSKHDPLSTCAALLRGINVSGKNLLPMRDLTAMFTAEGAADVTTYIQSGNVAFKAPASLLSTLAGAISQRIDRDLGLRVPVILRTGKELAAIPRAYPFLTSGAATDTLHVMFLADKPSPDKVAALDPHRSPPHEFAVVGREVFLRCPDGFGHTKFTNAYFDRILSTTSTVRNWRTLLKLVEMTASPAP